MTAAVCPRTSVRPTRRPTADSREVRGSHPGQPQSGLRGAPPESRSDTHHPGPVAFRRRRLHEPNQVGPAATLPEPAEHGKSGLHVAPRPRGSQPARGPLRAAQSWRHGSPDQPARADGGQIQCDPAPLQPVEQPRQLVGAARRHQQPHPGAVQCHRSRDGRPAQQREPGVGRQVEYVETQSGQQPDRRPRQRGPAEPGLVPAQDAVGAGTSVGGASGAGASAVGRFAGGRNGAGHD